jgi:long-subunit acyl-CoA synthetase (AMP-forming)
VLEFWIEDGALKHKVAYEGKTVNVQSNYDPSGPTPDDVALVLHTSGTTGR